MVKKKGYTSVSQSEELSKFLSNETADMVYIKYASSDNLTSRFDDGLVMILGDIPIDEINGEVLPCWSQAALYNILPVVIGNILEQNALRLRLDKGETDFAVWYENIDTHYVEDGLDVVESNPVDAYFQMIIKLHERGLLLK